MGLLREPVKPGHVEPSQEGQPTATSQAFFTELYKCHTALLFNHRPSPAIEQKLSCQAGLHGKGLPTLIRFLQSLESNSCLCQEFGFSVLPPVAPTISSQEHKSFNRETVFEYQLCPRHCTNTEHTLSPGSLQTRKLAKA